MLETLRLMVVIVLFPPVYEWSCSKKHDEIPVVTLTSKQHEEEEVEEEEEEEGKGRGFLPLPGSHPGFGREGERGRGREEG